MPDQTPEQGQLIVVAVSNELAWREGWLCYCNSVKLDGRTKKTQGLMHRTIPFHMGRFVEHCDGCGRPRKSAALPPEGETVKVEIW